MLNKLLILGACMIFLNSFALGQAVLSESYFPHVISGSPNYTRITISHTGADDRVAKMQFITSTGAALAIPSLTLNGTPGAMPNCGSGCFAYLIGGGGYELLIAQTPDNQTYMGYLKVTISSTGAGSAGVPMVDVTVDVSYNGSLISEPPLRTPRTSYNHAFTDSATKLNGFFLINPDAVASNVYLRLYDANEPPRLMSQVYINSPAGGQLAYFLSQLFGSNYVPSGHYTVESSVPIFLWPIQVDVTTGSPKFLPPRMDYRGNYFDFNANGAADVAAYHLTSDQFFTDTAGNLGQYGWGGSDSYPIVWDYDGNGSTEVSFYHIPTNQWFVRGITNENLGAFGWGADESIPVPGDYNGDGVVDRAFYHWPTNRWFVEEGGGSFTAYDFGWGGSDSVPVATDYDGDGDTDMMLYHMPTNQWFVYGIGNLGQFGWNGSECMPVPGDWDGDGRTEIGIYHWPSNSWFWRNEDGTTHFLGQYGWGGMESFPIPGDYNGDGVVERAFYRPAENRWFIEGDPDFYWGWDTSGFMPITSQMTVHNWFRFVLGRF